jgi:prepilin-type N-terminal cleavage/methylation domain-containing protein
MATIYECTRLYTRNILMLYRQERAFTTVELLIVMMIVGIMAAFLTPHLGRWLSTVGVDTAARALASELQLGKMRAISQNTRYRINFDPTQATYTVQKEAAGAWADIGSPRLLPTGVRLVSVSAGRNPLYFEPLGTAPGGNAVITLQNAQGRMRAVHISTGGRVMVK